MNQTILQAIPESFKFNSKFVDNTNNSDIINAKIAVSL